MLQDNVRTGTYRDAIINNPSDFAGAVVIDVGAGTGILSFFAAQAGARKVYAVEASSMAAHAKTLVEANGYGKIIDVICGKVEEVDIKEKADIIISEPMGFMLVHERMLESYIAARDRFLKPSGTMFPGTGTIYVAPITDSALYAEQMAKVAFWKSQNFYGIDLSYLAAQALKDHFAQPVVGYFSPSCMLCSTPAEHHVDFHTVTIEELTNISIPFKFRIQKTAIMHGFGCWFDVGFAGKSVFTRLSTGPADAGTHWYQCRLLLLSPIAVNASQEVSGVIEMKANKSKSYDINVTASLEGTRIQAKGVINLQDQFYHYLQAPVDDTYSQQYAAGAGGAGTQTYAPAAGGTQW